MIFGETSFNFSSIDSYHSSRSRRGREKVMHALFTQFYFLFRVEILAIFTNLAARFGKKSTAFWINRSQDVLRLVESCGGRISISGLSNVRSTSKPVVFIGNHMSTLENLTLFGIIGPIKDVTYVVKKELVHHWMFGPVMRMRKPVVVGRTNPREDFNIIMEEGAKTLNNGQSVIIFPQSTRRSYFDPGDFNSVGVKLAQKAGVEIIPFAVKTDWWGNGRISSYFGRINQSKPIFIKFGEPFRVAGNGRKEHQAVIRFIENCQLEWK